MIGMSGSTPQQAGRHDTGTVPGSSCLILKVQQRERGRGIEEREGGAGAGHGFHDTPLQ